MITNNTEEVAQNKLLLLYILKMSPNNLTNNELTEFILKKGYMNYFAIQQYLSELHQGEMIEIRGKDENKIYTVLEKGEISLNLFESKIPDRIIQELANEFKLQEKMKIRETQVIGEFYPKENNQYSVNLKLVENDETLFSLYFDVATESQAKNFCNIWKENTESIYQKILNLFISSNG